MYIDNRTNLPITEVFKIITKVINSSNDPGETFYYGKIDSYTVTRVDGVQYKLEVQYLKRYVKWLIKEIKNGKRKV